ncbi:cyclopropane-fatty-acyl-phospholipid synthase family protein [Staphylococcus cohnii]|uniref:cyclopropane-fatty-acyl-phospholipid synthase family protein n=2 Tax=Staphylococcus cohnii TaxID=29382 RepID=UPI0029621C8A|nr:cyclopropane-fatty-acyl-phospholipid synthase family protein [Staphylococcus cohnii]
MGISIQKSIYKKLLKNLATEPFNVTFWDGSTVHYNDGIAKFHLTFNRPLNKKLLKANPMIALAEGYMDKNIEVSGDLEFIMASIFSQQKSFINKPKKKYVQSRKKYKNNKKIAKENASFHYDLGNDFYRLWLDKTMNYSCAYFKTKEDSLYTAQVNKINHILKKLNLQSGQSLLDIGSGWGHLIIEAAKQYNVQTLGITLSEEQYIKTKERIKAEGLIGQVDVKLMDYRELINEKRTFDRIVSVGMLEHVGHDHIPIFMENTHKLLNDGGVALLHCITGLVEVEGNDFLTKYIFPGGAIPSIRALVDNMSQNNLKIVDVESLRRHYTLTLRNWAENFEANLDKVREQFDERFIRMWRLYLNACAANFTCGVSDLHQFLITKGVNNELPMTRDYLYKDN